MLYLLNRPVFVILEFRVLYASLAVDSVRQRGVMIKEIPFPSNIQRAR
jgi:hypothetical protein